MWVLKRQGGDTVNFRQLVKSCSTVGATVWAKNMGRDRKDTGRIETGASMGVIDNRREESNF